MPDGAYQLRVPDEHRIRGLKLRDGDKLRACRTAAARQNVQAASRRSAFSRARCLHLIVNLCRVHVAFALANQAGIFLEVNSYNTSRTHHTQRPVSIRFQCSRRRPVDRRAYRRVQAPDHAILGGAHHGSRDSSASTSRCIIVC
jgi:hypothetical protein